MKQEKERIEQWLQRRLTLRLRVALWSAGLLLLLSVAQTLFVNLTAMAIAPRSIVVEAIHVPPGEVALAPALPTREEAPTRENLDQNGISLTEVILRQVRAVSLVGLALIVIAGGIGAYYFAGRALQPVVQLNEAVHHVDVHTLDTRLALSRPPDEVKMLADAFDAMLERLQEAFEAQSRFVADAAHELRTPLAILRANLEVTRANPQATLADYREATLVLERSLARLEQLVESLLLLAQKQGEVAPVEVTLGPLLEDVLLDLAFLAKAHQIDVELTGELETSVSGDSALLARAFYNLIENGIYYNQPGGRVSITLQQVEDQVVIAIADTGPGIPADKQARIFDRFYRLDRSRSRQRGGAGLGLSIVAHIIHLHGGHIKLQSHPGQGATFILLLPTGP